MEVGAWVCDGRGVCVCVGGGMGGEERWVCVHVPAWGVPVPGESTLGATMPACDSAVCHSSRTAAGMKCTKHVRCKVSYKSVGSRESLKPP